MFSAQDISDRFEIQDLLVKYCTAIDNRDFDELDDIFTANAIVDYSAAGGARGDLAATKAYLTKALTPFKSMQHMVGLPDIRVDGDSASARTILFNPMVVEQAEGPTVFFVGLWYQDELTRTDSGWRIEKRVEELSYFHNLPADFTPVAPK